MAAGFTHAAISRVKQRGEEKSLSSFHTVTSWARVANASDLMAGVEERACVSSVLDGGCFTGTSGQWAKLWTSPDGPSRVVCELCSSVEAMGEEGLLTRLLYWCWRPPL